MRQTATQALRRWAFALLAVALLAGGGAAAYTLLTPSQYSASTQLLVGPVNEDAEGIKASSQLIGTYAQLVVSGTALSNAANQVGGGLTAADVQAATAIQFSSATRILDITVTLDDPQAALKVVSSLKDQLLARTAQQSGPGSLSVVVDPQTSGLPIDRQPYLRGVVAGFTALLLGLLLVILLEQTRGVIRTFADVEAATGREPLVEFPRRSKGGSARHNDAPTNAAYRMLAAYLDTLPPGAGAHCVAVVGTGADGRSQMPLNLAITLAATGRRALLLENESEKARNLAVFDTAPIDITGQTALYLFAPDPTGNDFSVQRLGFTPETYQLAGAWAGSRSRGATEDAVAAAGAVADWIVLAPRAIQSSDVGLAWASAADAVLLVVEQGVTRRTELQAALVTLRRITNQPVEVVLAPQGVRDGQDTKASLRAIAAEAKAKADRRKGRGDAAAAAAASLDAAIEPPAARPALQQQAPGHGSGQDWPAPAGPASRPAPGARDERQPFVPMMNVIDAPPPGAPQAGQRPGGGSPASTPAASPAASPAAGPSWLSVTHPPTTPARNGGNGNGTPQHPNGAAPHRQHPDEEVAEVDLRPDGTPWYGTSFVPPPVVGTDRGGANGRPQSGTPGRQR